MVSIDAFATRSKIVFFYVTLQHLRSFCIAVFLCHVASFKVTLHRLFFYVIRGYIESFGIKGSIVKVFEHGFFVQSGEAGKLFGGDELMGLLAQLFPQLAQDSVAGLEALTGDALDVLGVYANPLLFHDPFLPF